MLSFLILALLAGLGYYLFNSWVVAWEEGIYIRYQGALHEETYEFIDFKVGRWVGMVEFSDARLKLHSVCDMPEYLFVDMGIKDWRLYKKLPSE